MMSLCFLKHQSFGGIDFQWRDRNLSGFIKNCILKMNKSLMGLERHVGNQIMSGFTFLGEVTL